MSVPTPKELLRALPPGRFVVRVAEGIVLVLLYQEETPDPVAAMKLSAEQAGELATFLLDARASLTKGSP